MKNLTPFKLLLLSGVSYSSPNGDGNKTLSRKLSRSMTCIAFIAFGIIANAQTLVQNFTLTNVVDGKSISLDQFSSSAAVVVFFTSNECPFDNYYKDRMKEMIGAYAGKVQFLLVNSNVEPEESAEKMAIHYTDLNVPYLSDKDQMVMNLFGAKKSPEAFLMNTSGGKFNVVYSGAIDDNPQVPKDANQKYLKDAIDKILAGQKIDVSNNRAVGCSIRRK